jgi:hypothetical protein
VQFISAFSTFLSVGTEPFGLIAKATPFDAALNTACAIGNDQVRLMARLHGQCEVHAFVVGQNRAWLAAIIRRGRETGVFRADQGWESVAELLASRDDCPVVTSYSVTRQFPNPEIAGWVDDEDGEGFYRLSDAERWRRALEGLTAAGGGLEMKPEDWSQFYFGDGVNGFHIAEQAWAR